LKQSQNETINQAIMYSINRSINQASYLSINISINLRYNYLSFCNNIYLSYIYNIAGKTGPASGDPLSPRGSAASPIAVVNKAVISYEKKGVVNEAAISYEKKAVCGQ
jgi:hypothetical protein